MSWNGGTTDKPTRSSSSLYVVATRGGRLFAFDAGSVRVEPVRFRLSHARNLVQYETNHHLSLGKGRIVACKKS